MAGPPDPLAVCMRLAFPDDSASHWIATATTAAILLLMAKLLLKAPQFPVATTEHRLRIVFVERDVPASASVPLALATATTQPEAASAAPPLPSPDGIRSPAPPPAAPTRGSVSVYGRDGSLQLPPQAGVDPLASTAKVPLPGQVSDREIEAADKRLHPPNPIDYRPTRFDKDWASDGSLADVAAKGMQRGLATISKKIFGEDPQAVEARPPPDVRFNPGLHEQRSDLGSEATGDAYKAAPIAYETAPDLKGEASRRIRDGLAELLQQGGGCEAGRFKQLLAPVRKHLADLQQVEYAMAHGPDPVDVEHRWPRAADSAYDQARRALWYARQQTASCRR